MFERETKREKFLETRQREIRLKERSRSEQIQEGEGGEEEGEETPEQLIVKSEMDFSGMVEMEQRRRKAREDGSHQVLFIHLLRFQMLNSESCFSTDV